MKKINLEKDKINKLLLSFSIPCIISLVVNALYNIVDQIFIGWGVGYLGNGATNIVFPITVICLALGLMFGDGCSSYLSLKLGEKKKEEAQKGVCSGMVASIFTSILLCIIILLFLPQLLNIFGCTKALQKYALNYGYVITIGIPFMMVGTTLNSIIRADGSPKFAMLSMIIGAVTNIGLDALAIFVLKIGVTGAALATIISQFITFLMNILYIKKFKTIKVSKKDFKWDTSKIKAVSKLGISSVITQLAIVIVITVQNTLFKNYGESSKFGSEIPITVIGIVMKVNQILASIIIGIAAGSQPIVGFNYGAKKYDRVKEVLKIVLISSFIVSVIAFILFQTVPEEIIRIFGSGNSLYNEFACLTFRIFLMLTLVNGIQISTGIFFQAIGKPSKSIFLTLSRQILFFIPIAIIFAKIFGVMGVLYAGPISDLLAFLISVVLLLIERKNLNKKAEEIIYKEKENKERKQKGQNIIITIAREYGSGGRYVGKLLSEKLGIKLYDKNLITIVANKTGLSASYIEENEQKKSGKLLSNFNAQYYNNMTNDDILFLKESEAIREIAKKGPCIIIGRCANYVLKENKNVFSIFLYTSEEEKVKRAVKYYGLDKKIALKKIRKINKARENHYKYYTDSEWKDVSNYDLALHVDKFGVEKTADMIKEIIEKKDNIL